MKKFSMLVAFFCAFLGLSLSIQGVSQVNPNPVRFKALTFNVWTAAPDAIARDVRISGADLACLQEASVDETRQAARLLGSGWVAVVPPDGSEYSFVAKLPLVRELGNTNIKRGGVGAIFRVGDQEAAFFCHHGDFPAFGPRDMVVKHVSMETAIANDRAYRERQMRELLAFAEPYRRNKIPVFLMGDFNSASHFDYANPSIPWPITTLISASGFNDSWRDLHPHAERKAPGAFRRNDPGISWSRIDPKDIYARMDFIFYAGPITPIESNTIDLESSDHIPVFTIFQLGESAEPVKLFRDCDFGGARTGLSIGRYTLADLQALGISNDDISSLKVSPGYRVTLYEHDSFQGFSAVRTEDQACLGDEWNDRVSSLVIEPTSHTAIAYRDCDYKGPALNLPIGRYTLADLQMMGVSNDDISSLRVQAGYRITLYEHDNFLGASTVRTDDQSCVGEEWNDRASSLVVEALSPTALFYRDINFNGPAVNLPVGRYTVADLQTMGLRNDDISSLRIQPGYRVTLYENANFDGASTIRTADDSWLGEWNDRVSSLVVDRYP